VTSAAAFDNIFYAIFTFVVCDWGSIKKKKKHQCDMHPPIVLNNFLGIKDL